MVGRLEYLQTAAVARIGTHHIAECSLQVDSAEIHGAWTPFEKVIREISVQTKHRIQLQ